MKLIDLLFCIAFAILSAGALVCGLVYDRGDLMAFAVASFLLSFFLLRGIMTDTETKPLK